jgi:hypothetical protein
MAQEISDKVLVRSAARSRVYLLKFMAADFFGRNEDQAADAAARLHERGLVCYHHFKTKKFPAHEGFSYVTCTKKGARLAGDKNRAGPFGEEATEEHLAVSFFCCTGRTKRLRLEPAEVKRFVGDYVPPANVPYVLALEREGPIIYRCYFTKLDVSDAFKTVVSIASGLASHKEVRNLLQSGQFGLAVLCPSKSFCASLNRLFRVHHDGGPSLLALARVGAFLGPQTATIREDIEQWSEACRRKS